MYFFKPIIHKMKTRKQKQLTKKKNECISKSIQSIYNILYLHFEQRITGWCRTSLSYKPPRQLTVKTGNDGTPVLQTGRFCKFPTFGIFASNLFRAANSTAHWSAWQFWHISKISGSCIKSSARDVERYGVHFLYDVWIHKRANALRWKRFEYHWSQNKFIKTVFIKNQNGYFWANEFHEMELYRFRCFSAFLSTIKL